jgi:hypothetical protein
MVGRWNFAGPDVREGLRRELATPAGHLEDAVLDERVEGSSTRIEDVA